MKTKLAIIAVVLAIVLAGCGGGGTKQSTVNASVASDIFSTDFKDFKSGLASKTQAQQDDVWTPLKGKKVQWSGQVYDAFLDSADKSKKHIVVSAGGSDFFDAILSKDENIDIKTLNKGTKITIIGTLSGQGSSLKSWELADSKIVP